MKRNLNLRLPLALGLALYVLTAIAVPQLALAQAASPFETEPGVCRVAANPFFSYRGAAPPSPCPLPPLKGGEGEEMGLRPVVIGCVPDDRP